MVNNIKETKLGLEKENNQGYLMKIIKYTDSRHIIVEFQDDYKAHVSANMERFQKGNIKNPNYRLGQIRTNKQGFLMKIIQYIDNGNITVEFEDEFQTTVKTDWRSFDTGITKNPNYRLGIEKYNNKGYLMKCIQYNNYHDILIEFQDKYKAIIHTNWQHFENGTAGNPYEPTVQNVGIIGNKYPCTNKGQSTKEFNVWQSMINRCFSQKFKKDNPTYKDVTCCEEWLLFENFYEWLHSQENFDKWFNNDQWALDKDILVKGNKIYSPDTCTLIPIYINSIFTSSNKIRGNLPIGVSKRDDREGYMALTIYGRKKHRAKTSAYAYPTPEDAFYLGYKPYKEAYIKQIAQEEYEKGNITEKCYDAMMSYQVEITD